MAPQREQFVPFWLQQGVKEQEEKLRKDVPKQVVEYRRQPSWKQELRGWLFILCVSIITGILLITALEYRALAQDLRAGVKQMMSGIEGGR